MLRCETLYVHPFSHVDHDYVLTFEFGACEAQIARVKGQKWGKEHPRGRFAKIPCLSTRVIFSGSIHITPDIAFSKSK